MLSTISCLFRLLAVPVLMLAIPMAVHAQAPSDTLYELRLTDGSLFVGRIEKRSAETLVVVTTSGSRVEIPASKLRKMHVARGRMVRGEYWQPDPNKTRLFFSPTARAVGHGQGYAGTFLIVLPFVAVGVSDYLTLAGGAPILFGAMKPAYFAPKLTLTETPRASFAIGTLAFLPDGPRTESVGIAFGVVTLGDTDNAVTAGIGHGYNGDDVVVSATVHTSTHVVVPLLVWPIRPLSVMRATIVHLDY